MVGIGEDDISPQFLQRTGENALHIRLGTHRHEGGCSDNAVRRCDAPCAGAAPWRPLLYFEGNRVHLLAIVAHQDDT